MGCSCFILKVMVYGTVRNGRRRLLGRKSVVTRILAQLDGMEKKNHRTIDARKSHNVADEGCESPLCAACALHSASVHEDLSASVG